MKKIVVLFLGLAILAPSLAWAHCQIPCGIYTDELRFKTIEEHAQTIEKAMAQIGDKKNEGHQQVRWIMNKESHAQEIQDIVSAYFLTQRIKPVKVGAEGRVAYEKSLELLHHMTFYAMKCKQTTDANHVAHLREATKAFHDHYFQGKEHNHE
ncbi:MAG: superoxide dismutase [Candidatus Eisenbacteria bacterium]|uniref:Superoxide dismutase n=1 Tax=Eiseniibacteriota bacterium TaxID=2212470 RepID=A0A7Y2E8V4_UNCEI|nr:superoxide dismutase [Candidatus Eisenbacteria bacterium]